MTGICLDSGFGTEKPGGHAVGISLINAFRIQNSLSPVIGRKGRMMKIKTIVPKAFGKPKILN